MKDNNRKWLKFIIIIVLFFGAQLFPIILINIFNINVKNMSSSTYNLLVLISSLLIIIIFGLIYYNNLKDDFKDFKKNFNSYFSIGFKYWLIGIIIMFISNVLINIIIKDATAANEEAIQNTIKLAPFTSLILTTITAPIIEELTFRKSFKEIISHDKLYVIISGFIFGSIHVFFALTSWYDLAFLIPYTSLGIILGIMYVKTKNIFTSIFMHALHNGIFTTLSIILYFWGNK